MPHIRKQLNFKDKDRWYLVGLIAADGCLASKTKHVNITSKDHAFLETLKATLGLENKIGIKRNGRGQEQYQIQFCNRDFYDFLLSIGLTPAKSLTLSGLEVPEEGFIDFVRGVIDGDGSIRRWIHSTNRHEQWSLRVCSASPIFANWFKNAVESWFMVKGDMYRAKSGAFSVKFGKMAAQKILKDCYYEGCLSLERKATLARLCCASESGWSKSKTVFCVA
jgi:hypothetical protein